MFSRIGCFLCALIVSGSVFAQDSMSVVERPQGIKNQMAQRGMQDQAAPVLAILEPKDGATITSSTVNLNLGLSGDLKGYHPHKDPATNAGNHSTMRAINVVK